MKRLLFVTLLIFSFIKSDYVSGDAFYELSHHAMDNIGTNWFVTSKEDDFNPLEVKSGDVIFVRTGLLQKFFEFYYPQIGEKFILITHNSDDSSPGKFISYLSDDKIIAWFGQNPDIIFHKKFFAIPIGIANQRHAHGDISKINELRLQLSQIKKKNLLYLNLGVHTHSERVLVQNIFLKKSFVKGSQFKDFEAYLLDLAESKFVISPRGNGLDCHRTWEALLMGCIPIVRSSPMDSLYEWLPVLIINDWSEVTEQFLQQMYVKIKREKYSLEKLDIHFWRKKINACGASSGKKNKIIQIKSNELILEDQLVKGAQKVISGRAKGKINKKRNSRK